MLRLVLVTVAGLSMLGLVAVSTSAPASATESTPSCTGVDLFVGSGDCADLLPTSWAYAKDTTEVESEAVNGVDIRSSVTVLAYIQASGATASQARGRKITLGRNRCLRTSYKNTAGKEVWHTKCYARGKRFIKGRDGFWHDPVCWNKVVGLPRGKRLPSGAKLVTGSVKIVQSFVFSATARAKVQDYSEASAKAWANTYDEQGRIVCHSEGYGKGTASFYAEAEATVEGTVQATVRETARVRARGNLTVKLQGKTTVEVHADTMAKAKGSATTEAWASAYCAPYTPPPPAEKPPVFVQFREFNDLEVNWTDDHCVTVDTPAGHSATVYWDATYGSFATSQKPAQDGVQVCSTYKAPSEVPAGGTDTITVRVVDNVTDLSVTKSTQPFAIKSTAPHPA